MGRRELEQKLKALGYVRAGRRGAKHVTWLRPRTGTRVYVPQVDILNIHTAQRILAEAER